MPPRKRIPEEAGRDRDPRRRPARRRKTEKPEGEDGEPKEEPIEPGDTVRVHQAYLEALRGDQPPDPEAYLRAIEQFEQLPGAFRTLPGRVTPEEGEREPGDSTEAPEEKPPTTEP